MNPLRHCASALKPLFTFGGLCDGLAFLLIFTALYLALVCF
jgi:hypothetical protein